MRITSDIKPTSPSPTSTSTSTSTSNPPAPTPACACACAPGPASAALAYSTADVPQQNSTTSSIHDCCYGSDNDDGDDDGDTSGHDLAYSSAPCLNFAAPWTGHYYHSGSSATPDDIWLAQTAFRGL
ncbi:hypothetical protein ONZ51_g5366 [Trametes cubensis]|uniref:Uncharacterized protein n=1 Tax=Trametes cubensis TaxID=1111947 RepID=A0AAD7XB68_9APHY|nr:hypothetical protein ONZ51_g5366 [Trametes cubensis]